MLARTLAVALGVGAFAAIPALASDAPPSALAVAADLGITPESLVIAGFSTQDAATILSRLESVSSMRATLAADRALLDSAGHALTLSSTQLLKGVQDKSLPTTHANNQAAVANGATEVQHELDLTYAVAVSGFASEAVQALNTARAALKQGVPAEFCCLNLSSEQWQALRLALIAEKRAQRTGEQLNSDQATLLEDLRGLADVQAATAALGSGADAMRDVFAGE